MKKVTHRALSALIIAALVIAGVVFYGWKYVHSGASWASFFGSNNVTGTSTLTDRNGVVLATESEGKATFSSDYTTRLACYHAVGDLTGNIALQIGRGNVTGSPGQAQEFFAGAEYSPGGRTIIALPSRNLRGEANILVSVAEFPNQFTNRESLDLIVTDYGVASLAGRTIRERAQALIDIAHPDDRTGLVQEAKRANILYADCTYLPGRSADPFPGHQTFRRRRDAPAFLSFFRPGRLLSLLQSHPDDAP